MTEPTLRYRWRRTLADIDDDFVFQDLDLDVGRVHLRTFSPHAGAWEWSLFGLMTPYAGADDRGLMQGSVREVAARMEDEYDRLLPICLGLQASPRQEVAHFVAKGLPLPRNVAWRKAVLIDRLSRDEADRLYPRIERIAR